MVMYLVLMMIAHQKVAEPHRKSTRVLSEALPAANDNSWNETSTTIVVPGYYIVEHTTITTTHLKLWNAKKKEEVETTSSTS